MRVLQTLLFCAMCCLSAQADNFNYITPSGSSVSGLPVDADWFFSISNGTIDVFADNLQSNPTNVAQLLSGVSFSLGGGGSLSGASLGSSSAMYLTVFPDGTYDVKAFTHPTGWALTASGTTTATLGVFGTSTFPKHLIIGPAEPGGIGNRYSNADASIAGNKLHNPFLPGAVFTITGPNITAKTTITSATFSFGTTPGGTVEGVRFVPEPSASLLLGLGTLGLIGLATASRKLIST